MDLGFQVRNAVEDLRSFRDNYEEGHSDANLLILPAEDLLDVTLEKRCDELPEGYVWFEHLIFDAPNYDWIDEILNPNSVFSSDPQTQTMVQTMVSLLIENKLNPKPVAYRSGYIRGIHSVEADVRKRTRGHLLSSAYHRHMLSTRETIGLLGESLDGFKDSKSVYDYFFDNPYFQRCGDLSEVRRRHVFLMSHNAGFSLAIWRDFRYRLADTEQFIVSSEALDAFSRGLTNEAYLRNITGPGYPEKMNRTAYNWGEKINEHLQQRYFNFGLRADPYGFNSIIIDRIYDRPS